VVFIEKRYTIYSQAKARGIKPTLFSIKPKKIFLRKISASNKFQKCKINRYFLKDDNKNIVSFLEQCFINEKIYK